MGIWEGVYMGNVYSCSKVLIAIFQPRNLPELVLKAFTIPYMSSNLTLCATLAGRNPMFLLHGLSRINLRQRFFFNGKPPNGVPCTFTHSVQSRGNGFQSNTSQYLTPVIRWNVKTIATRHAYLMTPI